MWISPTVRGHGLGRRLLGTLEEHAARLGCRRVRLDANRVLKEAISLYRRMGYREIAAYSTHPYAHHWFERPLVPEEPATPE